jgi:protein-tyrosine phosphatase
MIPKVYTILPKRIYQRGHLLDITISDKQNLFFALQIKIVLAMARQEDEGIRQLLGDKYLWKPIADGAIRSQEELKTLAEEVYSLQAKQGGAVLVYCNAGRNRSSLMSALLLMRHTGCSGAVAVQALRRARPNALANPDFVTFLEGIPGTGIALSETKPIRTIQTQLQL